MLYMITLQIIAFFLLGIYVVVELGNWARS